MVWVVKGEVVESMEDVCACGVHVVVWMVEGEVVELVEVQVSPAPTERIVMP